MNFSKSFFFLFVLVIAFFGVISAQSFEGTIKCEYKHTLSGQTIDLTYHISNNQIALEMNFDSDRGPGHSKYIPNLETGEMEMITIGQKPEHNTYRTVQANDVQKPSGLGSTLNTTQGNEEKAIQGHNCSKIIINSPGTKTVSWISTDLNIALYQYAPYFKSDQSVAGLSQLEMAGFPMESATYDQNGNEMLTIKVVSIEEMELADEVFEVPAGFKEAKVEITDQPEGK